MAVLTSEVLRHMQHDEQDLQRRIHHAEITLDGELPKLQHQLDMVQMEKRKLERAYGSGFGQVPVKMEGGQVWYDDKFYALGTIGHNSFIPTPEQSLEMAELRRMAEFEQSKKEKNRRAALLAAPHNACALSVAINMWIVKFGDGWVCVNDIPNEPSDTGEMNWNALLGRLKASEKIEGLEDYVRVIT